MDTFRIRQQLSSVSSKRNFSSAVMTEDMQAIRDMVANMLDEIHSDSGDPIVWRTTRMISMACSIDHMPTEDERRDCTIQSVWKWLKNNVMYVNDPSGKEVEVAPAQLIADLKTPPNVLAAVLGPVLGDAILGYSTMSIPRDQVMNLNPVFAKSCLALSGGRSLCAKSVEDCDSLARLPAAMLKSVGIPVRLVVGGHIDPADNSCAFHHIWIQAQNSKEKWIDMDLTRPESTLGWRWDKFECVQYTDEI
jgi:hypothetical protein